ncbi:MAG: hypothetical protein FWC66_05235 [Oscillospiraceae bacterium]|nr:hypothetical protein [Oscillospiraceae bacterium]
MAKAGSGREGGRWAGEGVGGGVAVDPVLAGREVMRDIAVALSRGIAEFPEISAFANISEIREGDFGGGILGIIDGSGNITLQSGLRSGNFWGSRQWVAAHEVAHGLTRDPPQGIRTAEQTMAAAAREYNRGRTSGRLTQAGLAGRISNYARASPREAVAEAFADWAVNGNNASDASLIIMRNWRRP